MVDAWWKCARKLSSRSIAVATAVSDSVDQLSIEVAAAYEASVCAATYLIASSEEERQKRLTWSVWRTNNILVKYCYKQWYRLRQIASKNRVQISGERGKKIRGRKAQTTFACASSRSPFRNTFSLLLSADDTGSSASASGAARSVR
jgi:hypothetical protein